MADGQRAGLCHYSKTYALLGVSQTAKTQRIEFESGTDFITGPELTGEWLWIKSTWGLDGISRFYFSTDGQSYTPFGNPYQLAWGSYRGSRIGIYSFNNLSDTGHIDIDEFNFFITHQSIRASEHQSIRALEH